MLLVKRMSIQSLFLGVDGGGSGCRAALATGDGTILANATTGPANAKSDYDAALSAVRRAIDGVTNQTGQAANLNNIPCHIGLAGIMSEAEASRFARDLDMPHARVSDDRQTTLAGALGTQDGLLASIGTGSFVGVATQGKTRFLGGWGLQLGDQASGAWLGKSLLRETMLGHDGLEPQSPLTISVLQDFGSANAIVDFATSASPANYARFAPQVIAAAQNGDPTAQNLMRKGAGYLLKALNALAPGASLPICLTGGIAPQYAPWLPKDVKERLQKPAGTPLEGALLLARQK